MKKKLALIFVLILLFSACAPLQAGNTFPEPVAGPSNPAPIIVPEESAPCLPEPSIPVAEHHITPPFSDQAPRPSLIPAFRYGRGFLTGAAALLYDRLSSFLDEMDENKNLKIDGSLHVSDVTNVIEAFLTDNPLYYWAELSPTENENGIYVNLALKIPKHEIVRRKRQIDKRTHEILSPVDNESDFMKALAIYDALAMAAYDRDKTNANSVNIYGILVEGKATCYGYANGFQYLAGLAGLDSVLLKGYSKRGVPHAWNAVRLDGSWHFLDVTWARPLNPDDGVYHDFFLIDKSEMLKERRWEGQYPALPEPSGGFMGYYERMGYSVSGIPGEDAAGILAGIFYKQLNAMQLPDYEYTAFLELKVIGGADDYLLWKKTFVKELFVILQNIRELSEADGYPFAINDILTIKCDFNDTMQVLTLYPVVLKR